MQPRRKRTVGRWLVGREEYLPASLRLALFLFGLAGLAGIYLATESEAFQVLFLFVLVFAALPVLVRRFGVPEEYAEATGESEPPASVLALSLLFAVPWGVLTYFVVPEGLGPWFWYWLILWPWFEAYSYFAHRALRRDGPGTWRKSRPVRDRRSPVPRPRP